ncbi:ATP-binding protein [Aureimonas sp. AU22]|uniref:ATP-binding protein n=1 Tax=Aureimonas sp. AU22 TaxID=1638162 RepID=UPI0009EB6D56|nr:ATP-binding protein [Aureimonas sp. AU22]
MTTQLSFVFEASEPPELSQLWTPDEIYDRLSSENIHLFNEDRRLERKSARIKPKQLGEYLSMWSNTHPYGGIILIGIEDDGSISGCASLNQVQINELHSLSAYCEDARYAVKQVAVTNSKGGDDFVIAIRVNYRDDKLVEISNGKAFIREGDKRMELTETLKREVRIAKHEIHYELEQVNLNFPDDFDRDQVSKFCTSFAANRGFKGKKTVDEILGLAKLGKVIGGRLRPNLACALLFARDPREVIPGARIRIIRYEGTEEQFGDRLNSVFSRFVDGPIPTMLAEAREIIEAQIKVYQRLVDGKLTFSPEYPQSAWFEAIVNAVAHRSYNLKTQNIFVKIFDDRFVVESPGGFVPPTTSETVYDAHNPRNPFLMEAMMQFELTFCGFEGTRRMRQDMQRAGLPAPNFIQKEVNGHQVHVTLSNDADRRRKIREISPNVFLNEELLTSLTDDERRLISAMTEADTINITLAALILKRSWPYASKVINGLVERGLIEPANNRSKKHDATKRYRIKKQPRNDK